MPDKSEEKPVETTEATENVNIEEKDKKKEEEVKVTPERKESKTDSDNMVDVPLDDIKHQENDAPPAGSHQQHKFLTQEWEQEWK
jgi:hypothetical protein